MRIVRTECCSQDQSHKVIRIDVMSLLCAMSFAQARKDHFAQRSPRRTPLRQASAALAYCWVLRIGRPRRQQEGWSARVSDALPQSVRTQLEEPFEELTGTLAAARK